MRLFITGGAGFLGKHIVRRFYDEHQITIFSRDEAKHYYLMKQFPKIKCIIGDVSNYDLLKRASRGFDIGIFAASLKQIEAVDQNVEVALNTIIQGAVNSRRVAEVNKFKSACFISTDKSRSATTLYGSMKFVAGELFIVNANESNVNLSTAIYGNVLNSTGSIIPLMWDSIQNGYSLTLFSSEMTRFMIDADEAVDVIQKSLKYSGYNIIPNIKSFKVSDLFEIFAIEHGMKYNIGKPRISEKLHEIMIAQEEIPRTFLSEQENVYLMHYKNIVSESKIPFTEFSSRDYAVSKSQLYEILKQNNFYRP
jgi:UDP-N-acetylglucosamine 4,6-dehydratase